uniref:Uncharacterized protein n=1 Tax=Fagus sylvatica TaxID=28930 RepID=A0A2N9EL49_FAGSY
MTSSSSLNTQEAIDLNDVPSVMHAPSSMPKVWRPYFLSPNGPVTVTDSVMLNGVTATAVAAGLCTSEDGKSTEQSKTTTELQKQYEKLLVEVKELASRSIP